LFPVVEKQRFWKVWLNELIDYCSYLPKKYVENKKTAREVVESLIREVEYPFYMGQPDDTHIYNAYHGKWCKKIDLDYWDTGSEVLATMIADCDGSAIVAATCLRAFGITHENVYVAFGYVTDLYGNILGGHAWTYAKDKSFGSDEFVLLEMTLDEPPKSYLSCGKTVDDLKNPKVVGNYKYVPEFLWNDKNFIQVELMQLWRSEQMSKLKLPENSGYFNLKRKHKETRRKYVAIMEMWKVQVKPLKKAGLLSKLRWRK